MMAQGMVYLYYRDGSLVSGKPYRSVGMRREIINTWKKNYSHAYGTTFIQIAPIVNCSKVLEDGENVIVPKRYTSEEKRRNKGLKYFNQYGKSKGTPKEIEISGARISSHIYIKGG